MLRGLHAQPRADQCRRQLEEHLETDVRIKNAKARLAGRSRRRIGEGVIDKTFEDLEEAAMTTGR